MSNFVLVGVLDARNNLLEYFSGFVFAEPFAPSDEVKQLSPRRVFEHHEYFALGVDELK